MRKHWMAIPIAAVAPFQVLAFVLWETEHWSDGALGTVQLGLMSIAAIVGSLMAPIDPETGRLIQNDRREARPAGDERPR